MKLSIPATIAEFGLAEVELLVPEPMKEDEPETTLLDPASIKEYAPEPSAVKIRLFEPEPTDASLSQTVLLVPARTEACAPEAIFPTALARKEFEPTLLHGAFGRTFDSSGRAVTRCAAGDPVTKQNAST
jgi:hypothetical protein